MSESGSVLWPSPSEQLWSFDWRLADSPDEEGIVIRTVRYRGRDLLYKASLPSLRVRYDGPYGPYKDPLNWNNAEPTSKCPNTRVCLYSYMSGGLRGLGVESYHRISSYRITHRWVFWEHGLLMARLYSAGLQHDYDHDHHAYWRFDFDIEDRDDDVVFEYNNYTSVGGWGSGWHAVDMESTRVKNPSFQRIWAVSDLQFSRGYYLLPGAGDGTADWFSHRDLWVLRYNNQEDRNGQQGSASDVGLDAYVDGEDVNGKDVVLWYCAHLRHYAADAGSDWHGVGPNLWPLGNWS